MSLILDASATGTPPSLPFMVDFIGCLLGCLDLNLSLIVS